MKIGVLSDIHLTNDNGMLQKIIDKYMSDVDMFFLCGDFTTMRVYDLFADKKVAAVAGNMDSRELRSTLPVKRVLDIHGFKFGLIHGWGPPGGIERRIRKEFNNVDCIVYGHSHAPANSWSGGALFFNPGSPTDKRFAAHNSVGILTVTDEKLEGEIIRI